jgi:DNA-binding NarL/FixJ family response regulator
MPGMSNKTDARQQGSVGVLVVDDQAVFRAAAIAVIELTPGFSLVCQADSGEEAIELVHQNAPDLVLLDVSLPKLDGVATARAIFRIRPASVAVLLSAGEHPDIATDPGAHGAAAFLPKESLGSRTLRELWATRGPWLADHRMEARGSATDPESARRA